MDQTPTREPLRRTVLAVAIIAVGLVPLGCGPANQAGRVAVSGTVTLDGQPLDSGAIEFSPLDQGLASGSTIGNGRYTIKAHRGLPAGKYRVRIYAPAMAESVGEVDPNQPPGPEASSLGVERVAPQFNSASELTVEVLATNQSQMFDFAVSSK